MNNRLIPALALILLFMLQGCWWGPKRNDSPASLAKALENPNAQEILVKVSGLDSANVETIQNRLAEEPGVLRNFACYSDSNIFIKFDTTLIHGQDILGIIRDFGFPVVEAPDVSEE